MIPAKPKKDRETMAAEIRVMGRPSKDLAGFSVSRMRNRP
jgi:hypothetical protein